METVYSNPGSFGLEQVAIIDYSDGNYCFDYRVIWRDNESGKLLTARDSGCSCPIPFESYTTKSDLEDFNAEYVIQEARNERAREWYNGDSAVDFIAKVRSLAG